jgi:hypothetical protein
MIFAAPSLRLLATRTTVETVEDLDPPARIADPYRR